MTICRLCKEDKILIKKSHIIPDFLYKELFDRKHSLKMFNAVGFKLGSTKISQLPTGEYEGGLLCSNCDGVVLGQFESYLAKILRNSNIPENQKIKCCVEKNENGVQISRITNVDYKKLKLCLLSILWRSSISSRKMFREVNLGPYEEKLRMQLLEGNPSSDNDIEICILSWRNDKKMPTDVIGQPRRHKLAGSTFYSLLVSGYLIIYFITNSHIHKMIRTHKLREDNTLSIIYLPEGYGIEFLLNYTNSLCKR